MRFGDPEMLVTLVAAPLLAGAMGYAAWARKRDLARFGDPELVRGLRDGSPAGWRAARGVSLVLAVVLLALAVARPQHGSRTEVVSRRGIDVVVCLDVSKSMLARDVAPSRIERAKAELARLIDEEPGDRIGVVLFAGETLEYPLTTDHEAATRFFRDVHPWEFPAQGTSIGRAIIAARETFRRDPLAARRSKVMIVITDGEDLEGDPVAAARRARGRRDSGVHRRHRQRAARAHPRVLPRPVRWWAPRLDSRGQPKLTQFTPQMEQQLRSIAQAGHGQYFRPRTGEVGIDAIRRQLARLRRTEVSEASARSTRGSRRPSSARRSSSCCSRDLPRARAPSPRVRDEAREAALALPPWLAPARRRAWGSWPSPRGHGAPRRARAQRARGERALRARKYPCAATLEAAPGTACATRAVHMNRGDAGAHRRAAERRRGAARARARRRPAAELAARAGRDAQHRRGAEGAPAEDIEAALLRPRALQPRQHVLLAAPLAAGHGRVQGRAAAAPGWTPAAWNLELARRRKDEEDHPDAGPDAGQDASADSGSDAGDSGPQDGGAAGNPDGGNNQGDGGNNRPDGGNNQGDSGSDNGPDAGAPEGAGRGPAAAAGRQRAAEPRAPRPAGAQRAGPSPGDPSPQRADAPAQPRRRAMSHRSRRIGPPSPSLPPPREGWRLTVGGRVHRVVKSIAAQGFGDDWAISSPVVLHPSPEAGKGRDGGRPRRVLALAFAALTSLLPGVAHAVVQVRLQVGTPAPAAGGAFHIICRISAQNEQRSLQATG
ncbi:MAG: VWA domain-containing protein [Polyangiales bacterium]